MTKLKLCGKNLENLKFDKSQIVTNSRTQIMTETLILTNCKLWQNSNCDKTKIVTKLKFWQNSKYEEKTQNVIKLKMEEKSRTKIVTKLKKNQIVTQLERWQISIYKKKRPFNKNIYEIYTGLWT